MRSSRVFIALACVLTASSAHAAIRTCVSSTSVGHAVSDQFSRLPGGGVTWMDDWDPQNRVLVAQPAGVRRKAIGGKHPLDPGKFLPGGEKPVHGKGN